MTNAFTPPQVEALSSLASILGDTKWVLIGASAIRCRLSLQRRTFDLDLAVGASTASVEPELLNGGWTRDPKMVQRWIRSGATVDLVHATQDDIDEGVTSPLDDVELTVIGFDLAYEELDLIDIGAGMRIPVARVHRRTWGVPADDPHLRLGRPLLLGEGGQRLLQGHDASRAARCGDVLEAARQVDSYRIKDYVVERPFAQRLLGTGNLVLHTMDQTTPTIALRGVRTDVVALYEKLRAAAEAQRQRRGVRLLDNE